MKKLLLFPIFFTLTMILLPNFNATSDPDMYETDEPITVTEAITDVKLSRVVHVEGVVTHSITDDLFYIQNPNTGDGMEIRCNDNTTYENIEQGQKITVLGEASTYTSWGNNHFGLVNCEITSIDTTIHELHVTEGMTIQEIINSFDYYDDNFIDGEISAPYSNYRVFRLHDVEFEPVGEFNVRQTKDYVVDEYLATETDGDGDQVHLAYNTENTEIDGLSTNTYTDGEIIETLDFLLDRFNFGDFMIHPIESTQPEISIILNGSLTEYLSVGDHYEELGATATNSADESVPVTINGEVDTEIPGTYTIEYTAESGDDVYKRSRTVIVEGAFIPTLELKGDEITYIEFGDTYVDEGARVAYTNGEDFDITTIGTVDTHEAGEHKISYTTTASDGTSVGPIERTVIVQNPDAPIFDSPDSIIKNADYIAPTEFYYDYISVTDFEGNDITASLEIIKNDYNGNANVPGTYDIIFRATDSHDTSSRYTIEITVQRNLLPLLIIDENEFVLSYVYQFTDEDFVDTLKSINSLANETFIFTDEYDNYSANFNAEGSYSKEFSLLSESGHDHNYDISVTVVDDDADFIQAEIGFFGAAWAFIQSWWIALGVLALILVGLKAR